MPETQTVSCSLLQCFLWKSWKKRDIWFTCPLFQQISMTAFECSLKQWLGILDLKPEYFFFFLVKEFLFKLRFKNSLEFFRCRCFNHTLLLYILKKENRSNILIKVFPKHLQIQIDSSELFFFHVTSPISIFSQNILLCTSRILVITKAPYILYLMALQYFLD